MKGEEEGYAHFPVFNHMVPTLSMTKIVKKSSKVAVVVQGYACLGTAAYVLVF